MFIVVAFFIIFMVTWTKRSVNVKAKKQDPSFESLNSPASIQFDQEPIDTVSPYDQIENVEQL
jgi:hypothetical protein